MNKYPLQENKENCLLASHHDAQTAPCRSHCHWLRAPAALYHEHFDSKIFSNFLADLSSGAAIFTTDSNNRTCCIVTHNSHILSAQIQRICKY